MLNAAAPGPLSYTNFDPHSEWLHGDESETLLLDVSGFKKEQMKVLINTSGSVKISGERPLEGQGWIRFVKEYRVPKNCNPKDIQAKFDKDTGLLYILLPKKATNVAYPTGIATSSAVRPATGMEDEQRNDREMRTADDRGAMVASELGVAGRKTGTGRHKVFILNVVMAVMVLLGIGGYAVYRFRFSPEKEKIQL